MKWIWRLSVYINNTPTPNAYTFCDGKKKKKYYLKKRSQYNAYIYIYIKVHIDIIIVIIIIWSVRGPWKKRFVITSRGRRVRTFIRRGWGISARTDPLPNPSRAFRRNANGRKVAVGYGIIRQRSAGPPVKSNEPKRYSNSFNNGCWCVCVHIYVYTRNTDGSVVVFVDRRRRGG